MENILLISIDSLRTDVCGFQSENDCTPYLTSLEDESVIFDNAISPGPRTPSSLPPLFTGEYYRHEQDSVIGRRNAIDRHLSTHKTIPSLLKDAGYTTVGFTANPWTATDTGFDRGFDEFFELNPNSSNDVETLLDSPLVRGIDKILEQTGQEAFIDWENKREWFSHWSGFYEEVSQKVRELEEPYFVWIFLMDTHQPYIVPRALYDESNTFKMYYSLLRFWQNRGDELSDRVVKWMKQSYRDTARSADEFVKRFYEEFRSDDTTLIVHSDHGESHGEHSMYGHEYKLYEENVHVPFLIHGCNKARRVERPFSLTKLPTIIEEISSTTSIDPEPHTNNLVIAEIESKTAAQMRGQLLEYEPHDIAIRGKRFKYIQGNATGELYDLSNDPGEEENIIDSHPEVAGLYSDLARSMTKRQTEKREISEDIQNIELE